ncbi:MAG: DNA cytosine methyltransferase [bacterium]|nr:DNA cytosine methyltransferase [bacterium]
MFRKRSWAREFFDRNGVQAGDRIAIERVSGQRFALTCDGSRIRRTQPTTTGTLRALDLFSGAGGLTLGLKESGIEPIAAVECRAEAAETYKKHTPDANHYCTDIREVEFSKYRGAAPLVYGGPPCQPFSTGGLRKGTSDKRNMIPAFLAAVEAVKPEVVLMENVPGLAVASRIHYLHDVLGQLTKLGYQTSYRVLNAAHYGVPQKRRRLFVIATRDRAFWFPKPTHGPGTGTPMVPTSTVVHLDSPIGEPPDCPVVYAKYPDPRPSPYAGQLYNGGGRPIDLSAPCHTILASAGGYKTHWVDTEEIAPRYNRHLRNGGKPWEGAVPGARRLTIEESALIQTFPSRMSFAGSRSAQYTQVGDAVPPLLATILGQALLRQLNGIRPDESEHLPPIVGSGMLW